MESERSLEFPKAAIRRAEEKKKPLQILFTAGEYEQLEKVRQKYSCRSWGDAIRLLIRSEKV